MILKRFIFILKILVDQWVSSVSIELMEKFCVGTKIVYSISIEKLVCVWKGVNPQDVNSIIIQFCACFISFEWVHSRNILSTECCQLLHKKVYN